MIKVTIWWDAPNGSSLTPYLINVPTEANHFGMDYFKAAPVITAIRRALTEFERDRADARVSRIEIDNTPDKVLEP